MEGVGVGAVVVDGFEEEEGRKERNEREVEEVVVVGWGGGAKVVRLGEKGIREWERTLSSAEKGEGGRWEREGWLLDVLKKGIHDGQIGTSNRRRRRSKGLGSKNKIKNEGQTARFVWSFFSRLRSTDI